MTTVLDHEFADVLVEREKNSRWDLLDQAADFIVARLDGGEYADLIFVCTHNSRRSQFAHAWAHVFAGVYGLTGIRCYSGGTEVTACNERTIASLERFGFQVQTNGGENPDYKLTYGGFTPASSPAISPVVCNSSLMTAHKVVDFAAFMCCSDADVKCPTVPGAAARYPLHYLDPKVADGTPEEVSRYDERCREIGRDMLLLMSEVSNRRKKA